MTGVNQIATRSSHEAKRLGRQRFSVSTDPFSMPVLLVPHVIGTVRVGMEENDERAVGPIDSSCPGAGGVWIDPVASERVVDG